MCGEGNGYRGYGGYGGGSESGVGVRWGLWRGIVEEAQTKVEVGLRRERERGLREKGLGFGV